MQRRCALTGAEFQIGEAELEYCREYEVPLPTLAPEVRLRRLVGFRNRSFLYNAKCALSGKPMFSSIAPERGLTVYDIDVWNSDAWDWRHYGRPYDFSRPFFEQFADLYYTTPMQSLAVLRGTM
jgi:hypothetical protein